MLATLLYKSMTGFAIWSKGRSEMKKYSGIRLGIADTSEGKKTRIERTIEKEGRRVFASLPREVSRDVTGIAIPNYATFFFFHLVISLADILLVCSRR